jgi:hypothetical protein
MFADPLDSCESRWNLAGSFALRSACQLGLGKVLWSECTATSASAGGPAR